VSSYAERLRYRDSGGRVHRWAGYAKQHTDLLIGQRKESGSGLSATFFSRLVHGRGQSAFFATTEFQ
jgi:hypothetical protein